MGRKATGGAYTSRGKFYGRPMVAGERQSVLLPTVADIDEARERAGIIAAVVAQLEKHQHQDRVERFVAALAAAPAADVAEIVAMAAELCDGRAEKVGQLPAARLPTLTEMNDAWVSGDLHRRFPDYVKLKRSARHDGWHFDKHIKPHVGHLTVDAFTRDHAKFVMSKLPEGLSPITRRHTAQHMNRLLGMAVWPLEYIAHNPIPRGFLPKLHKRKSSPFVYPDEEAKLLACEEVPLERRVLYALLAREGLRKEEGALLDWAQLDLERGTLTLEDHKTADEAGARTWALDPGLAEALRRWRKRRPKDVHVFPRYNERGVYELNHLADNLRADLTTAGVDREELFTASAGRLRLRAHDFRTGFCSLALAMGRTEDWCSDRTGHTRSEMLKRYKRSARHAQELGLGWWKPAHEAIPELADEAIAAALRQNSGGSGAVKVANEGRKEKRERKVRTAPAGTSRGPLARGRGLSPSVAHVAITADKRGVAETAETTATTPPPLFEGDSGDAAAIRRALVWAVDRGDLAGARVMLAELERLKAESLRAARSARVVPIGAGWKRGDR